MSEATLILASASPRRRALLEQAGIRFEVKPADLDESAQPGESPSAQATRLAREKAEAVAATEASSGHFVLGADTMVVLDDAVLGKPADPAEAISHLTRLAGRTHRVVTAVALVGGDGRPPREVQVESEVTLRALDPDEIRAYVATGESLDKAGGYALQGAGRHLVQKVVGSETNVIGLPLPETLALLRDAGITR